MKPLRNAALAATLPFFFYACAKSNQGEPVTAYVVKGPVTGAQCKLHRADNHSVLAGPVASKQGHVDFGASSHQGLAYVVCQGGTYIDEISGREFDLGKSELRAAQAISGPAHFVVSPVTEIAVKRALIASETLTAENVAQANKDTADYFGLGHVSIVTENPADITKQAAENTPAGWYGTVLAGLSGLTMQESGLDRVSLTDSSIVYIGSSLNVTASRLSDPVKNKGLLDDLRVQLNGLTKITPNPVSDVILSGIMSGLGSAPDHVPGTINDALSVSMVSSTIKQSKFTFDVMGTGFQNPMKVFLGGQEVTEFTIHSGINLSLIQPVSSDSALDLALEQGDKRYVFANAFTPADCDVCNTEQMSGIGCTL